MHKSWGNAIELKRGAPNAWSPMCALVVRSIIHSSGLPFSGISLAAPTTVEAARLTFWNSVSVLHHVSANIDGFCSLSPAGELATDCMLFSLSLLCSSPPPWVVLVACATANYERYGAPRRHRRLASASSTICRIGYIPGGTRRRFLGRRPNRSCARCGTPSAPRSRLISRR